MSKHHGGAPVLRLLARLGWQRDPATWTVRGHDHRGRPIRVKVQLKPDGIVLSPSSSEPWILAPLEAGRLRAALRDALLTLDQFAGDEHTNVSAPDHAINAPMRPADAVARQRVRLDLPVRLSVHDIANRVSSVTTPDLEVNHEHHDIAADGLAHCTRLAS